MLRLLVIFVLSLFSINVYSQVQRPNEIIAEGGAKVNVAPDVAIFTLTVEKNDTIEKNAIKALNAEIEDLVKSLNKIGFNNQTIKVSEYTVSSSMDDNRKKDYTATNRLKVEFKLDNKLIDAFYTEIQEAALEDLDVAFDTKLSDMLEKTTRMKLIQLAIEDAKMNANSISKALNVKIVGVTQVQKYAERILFADKVEMVRFTPPRVIGDTDFSYKTSFDKFRVEEIELEEKITIVYAIASK